MVDVTVFNVQVPAELFNDVEKVCAYYGSDFRSEVVRLLEIYVDSYKRLTSHPAFKDIVGGD